MNSLYEEKKKKKITSDGRRQVWDDQDGERETHLLAAVLLQTVEQLVRVGEPEGQQLQIFLITLKSEVTVYFAGERPQDNASDPRSSLTRMTFLTAPITAFMRDLSLASSFR